MRRPWPWASRWTSSQTSAGTLRSAMILRTRGLKTSAPPPGIVSWPAARRRRRASAWSTLEMRAMKSTSTAVSAVSETCGSRAFSSEKSSS